MLGILLICIICITGFFIFANFRCYTAYTMNSTEAWDKWKLWKKQLESNGFEVKLADIVQHGTYTDFYYICKKKPQK